MLLASIYLPLQAPPSTSAHSRHPRAEPEPPLVGWTEAPNRRGTLDLILTCLITLSLCVWTALHLNIPPTERARWACLRFAKWVFIGALAPEFVLACAWLQFNSATVLGKKMKLLREEQEGKGITSQHLWTRVHGFFAGMGGFKLGIPPGTQELGADINLTSWSHPRFLTPNGILLFAECGVLPDISRDWILDKSKSDWIAKALVCLQALWMIIQVCGRLASHLTVTLLEVNTIGHVVCALGIYLMWWDKPRDIAQPIVIEGDFVAPLLAFASLCSQRKVPMWSRVETGHIEDSGGLFVYFPPAPSAAGINADPSTSQVGSSAATSNTQPEEEYGHFEVFMKRDDQFVGHQVPLSRRTAEQRARAKLAAKAIHMFPCLMRYLDAFVEPKPAAENSYGSTSTDPDEPSPAGSFIPRDILLIDNRAYNIPWIERETLTELQPAGIGLLNLTTVLYGGVHLAAWMDTFPSQVERTLWRIASVQIASYGLLVFPVFWGVLEWRKKHGDDWREQPVIQRFEKMTDWRPKIWWEYLSFLALPVYGVLLVALFAGGFMYTLSRVYLLVEAFASLRKMPGDAYDTPEWSELIPHF